jgi:hypothetical protein
MKILGRITYALSIALLLFFFHNFGTRLTADKFFANEGKDIFLNDGEDKYRLFYGSTGFHLNEPTYSFLDNDYNIQFFEINKVFEKEDDLKVDKYFYIMIDHPTHVLTIDNPQRYYIKFITDDEPITLRVHQFREIPFSIAINDENRGLIDVNALIGQNITKFEVIDFVVFGEEVEETVLASANITFSEDDLVIEDIVKNTYDNNWRADFNNDVYKPYKYDASQYNYIYYLTMLLYILIAVFTTYLVYFRHSEKKINKKRLANQQVKEIKNYK